MSGRGPARRAAGSRGGERRRLRRGSRVLAAALTAGLVLAGCGSDKDRAAAEKPRLKVGGAFMPEPVTTAMAAGFFTVTDAGGADTLLSVTSPLSDEVTLHTTEGGAMKERDSFPVPANGTLDFTRGGNHLMFEKLTHKPEPGDSVPVELHFKKSGTLKVSVPVKPATYNPAAHDRKDTGTADTPRENAAAGANPNHTVAPNRMDRVNSSNGADRPAGPDRSPSRQREVLVRS